MADIAKRKSEHLLLAQDPESQSDTDLFADWELPYTALPEINLKDVGAETKLLGKKLRQPLIIASMTGGADKAVVINKNLAIAARECGIAMGVGSQRAALVKPETRQQFEIVRKYAPKAVIFANMGAVQLNYGYGVEKYKEIVEMIQADALYLHLNPLQEALQPEGDTDFSGLTEKIANLVSKISVPVFVKEVGHGLSVEVAQKLIGIGIAGIDVAGVGGTSWAWIEGKRAGSDNLASWFKEFGTRTEESIREVGKIIPLRPDLIGTTRDRGEVGKRVKLIVSGGMRNPLQALKARALGADYYSAARPFLMAALMGEKELIRLVGEWEKGLRVAMFGCGVRNWEEARNIKLTKVESRKYKVESRNTIINDRSQTKYLNNRS